MVERISTRRQLLASGSALALANVLRAADAAPKMRFGLVTYMWGADWDLPTLIANCEAAQVLGVELQTTHKHGVEPTLSPGQRQQVRQRFVDSRVTLVGLGSDERFDSPDPAKLHAAIEATQAFIVLSRDVGGSGVKVKPDSFHDKEGIPREKTIDQIGRTLNLLGPFAAEHGQQLRLEVHGQCAELPTIRAILDIADPDLIRLLRGVDYDGWLLLEAGNPIPEDRVKRLIEQRQAFEAVIR